jgi:hypothetical protein
LLSSAHRYITLAMRIIRHGRLRHSGYDFNQLRTESLTKLSEFLHTCPGSNLRKPTFWKSAFLKNAVLRNILAQGAFIKSCVQKKGGHLSVPSLTISYIRIPKAASTSLSLRMLEILHPTLQEKQLNPTQINHLTDMFLHSTVSQHETSYLFFTVVRNPFARIVSVYRSFFEKPSEDFIYTDYLFGILKKNISFKEFVRRIVDIPDLLKDQHIKPQHIFLSYYKKNNIDVMILKLEDTQTLQDFLANHALSLPKINSSTTAYDYRSYYDAETIDIVYKLYTEDLITFRYMTEYNDLKQYVNNKRTL